jgi:hypothetical protein
MHIESGLTLGTAENKKEYRELSRKVKKSVEEAKKESMREV